MILHHYTPIEKFKLILESRKLLFSNFQNTNDSDEFSYGLSVLYPIFEKGVKILCQEITNDELKSEFKELINLFIKSLISSMPSFLFCLCHVHKDKYANCGLLSMWRSYADDGRGIALEFKTNNFIDDILIIDKDTHLKLCHKVNYKSDLSSFEKMFKLVLKKSQEMHIRNKDPKKAIHSTVQQLIKKLIKKSTRNEDDLSAYLMITSMFFKHPGFHEENEYRIVISGNLEPKIDFRANKINKIIIGPGTQENTEAIKNDIQKLLKAQKLDNIEVVKSDIPYVAKKIVDSCNECQNKGYLDI